MSVGADAGGVGKSVRLEGAQSPPPFLQVAAAALILAWILPPHEQMVWPLPSVVADPGLRGTLLMLMGLPPPHG